VKQTRNWSISFERLETVSGRDPQVIQTPGDLELAELASRHRLECNEGLDASAGAECLCIRIPVRDDHRKIVTRGVNIVKRD
jgi:hypothetical protein